MRQNHIFYKLSKATVCLIIRVLCKSCEPEIALNSNHNCSAPDWCLTQYLIQNKNNFTVTNLTKRVTHYSYELKNFEENINLSRIHSAVITSVFKN